MHQFQGRDKQRGDNGNEKMDAALFWTSELLGVVSMMMMMVMMILLIMLMMTRTKWWPNCAATIKPPHDYQS